MGTLAALYQNSKRTKKTDPIAQPGDFFYGACNKAKERETQRVLASFDIMAKKKSSAKE